MKKARVFLAVAALIMALAIPGTSQTAYTAEQPSFTLVCRSGGSMRAIWERIPSGISLIIDFGRSAYGATQRQPGEGECAWVDRPLRDSEPNRLYYADPDASIIRMVITATSTHSIGVKGDDMRYLIDAVTKAGRVFYVRCRNRYISAHDQRLLEITKVGP